MRKFLVLFLATVALSVGCVSLGISSPSISLGFPIDCKLGDRCFVLLYPDRDPSPKSVDYGCGRMTYDTHKGTDFAISDEVLMAQGVPVLAAAPGKVLRVRDGIEDRRITSQAEEVATEGQECGNGLVIDHGNGWETQYCHLRQGSVSVKPDQHVTAGDKLGLVGTSGLASFPHVHLSVRYQDDIVDPFVGLTDESGCQVTPNPLWKESLAYTPTGVIRSGVASEPPTLDHLWEGKYQDQKFSNRNGALVFWVHLYGLLEGDQESIEVRDPQGNRVVFDERQTDSSNRIAIRYAGKKFESGTMKPGTWTGIYELRRDGNVILSVHQPFEVTVS